MAIEIPEELVIQILSRLPPESLLRFRCVSKLWRSLISNPKFTLSSSSQRHLYIAHHPNSEFFYSFDDEHTSSTGPIPLGRMLRSINNKEMDKEGMWHRVQVLGSCNGLLLVNYYADMYLRNPTIRQCTKVLSLQVGSSIGDYYFMNVSGLCYDSYSDDYKAVSVDKYGSVTVISFRRKKWDKTICSPIKVDGDYREFLDCGPATAVIVNAKLHWLIIVRFPTPSRIVYFDPLTDEFEGFPIPEAPNNRQHNTCRIGLGVLEGCLCMAHYVWEEHVFTLEVELDEVKPIFIEVWVMKEHGVVESWTRAWCGRFKRA